MSKKFIEFISLALPVMLLAQSPGGVSADLSVWYKADNGVTANASKMVTQWDSSSGTSVSLTPNGTAVLPYNDQTTYTNTWNFNPTVTFNGTNNYLRNTTTAYLTSAGSVHYIVVARGTNRNNNAQSLFAIAGNDDGFFYSGGSGNTAFPTIGNNYNSAASAIASPDNFGIYSAILPKTPAQGIQRGFYNALKKNYTAPYPITGTSYTLPATGAYIGADGATGDNFYGDIAEVIIYHSPAGNDMQDADLEKVHSYLAVKYGITLTSTQNYLSSSNQIIWNAISNAGYTGNIAGIGRDVAGLNQKQSRSVNSGKQLLVSTIGLADTNTANSTSLTAGQYLIWGDNGQEKKLAVPISGIADVNHRFASVWKVQNTGSVGTVRIAWPSGIHALRLIQSTDAVFDATDTVTDMSINTQTVNGVTYNYADVTLADGQFFTFAGFEYAPGGVKTAAWYRADAANTLFSDAGSTNATDASTVQQWNEFNNKPFPLSQATATYRPAFSNASTLVNFNPTVTYTGGQKWLQYDPADAQGYILDRSKGALFSAGNTTSAASFFGFGVSGAGNAMDDPGLYNFTANKFLFYPVIGEYDPQSTYTINGPYIGGGTWQNGAGVSGNNAVDITLNGFHQTYNTNIANVNTAAARNALMIGKADAGSQLAGQQNEMIIFPAKLTDEEVNRVESYLAIKYGNTLSREQNRNYLSSAGTVVWDGSSDDYYNNVFGIARDHISALYQKQARSANNGQKLIIGAGNSLANTNAANTNTLTEGQFLLTGDNGLKQGLSVPLSYTAGSNGKANYRFESIWKVQNSGSVGNITVGWPKGVKNLYLVQSPDAAFDGTDTFTPMTSEVTVNGVVYNTANVTLGNGQFFTFAGFTQAPGGVVGPDFWVRSDDAGTIATAWKDNSPNADDIPNVGGVTVSPADRAHNFHPYTTGYSSTKYFHNNASVINPLGNVEMPNTNTSIFSATRPVTRGAGGRIIGIDNDPDNAAEPGISFTSGNAYRHYEYFAITTTNDITANERIGFSNIYSAIADNSVANGGTSALAGGEKRLGLNGDYSTGSGYSAVNRFQLYGNILRIGYATWNVTGAFPGDIMEVAWYNRTLTANEQSRVNSYLAVKNGVTSGENYLSTNSTVVWDRTINTGYNNNIFGIAKDEFTALDQKQSGSINEGQKLVISTTGFADTNVDNSTDLSSDLQYLIAGDNGLLQKLKIPLPSPYTTGTNGEANHRFEAIWKVQNSGGVGTITVAWPENVRNLYLVQSPDAVFDAANDTFTPMTAQTTVNGVVYNTANVTLADGQYFTLAGYLADYCVNGCNDNTYLNASDPNTIEYDNLVASDNAIVAKEKNNTFKIWGYRTGPTSIPSNANVPIDLLTPTAITPANGFNYTGTPLKAAVAGSTISASLLLTTDGLYGWGTKMVPYTKTTNNTLPAFGKITVNGKEDGLPPGVAPTDVKMMFHAYMSLVIVTCKGEAWTMNGYTGTTGNIYLYGDGSQVSTANNAIWHRVKTSASETLDNVVAVRGHSLAKFALTSEGKIYTWGQNTLIGDGTDNVISGTDRAYATEVVIPNGITPKMIGMTAGGSAPQSTYFLLATNGQLFAMGANGDQEMGDGTTTASNVWKEVTATSGGHTLGGNIKWISPTEHGRIGFAAINVLTSDKKQWGWGNNNSYTLGQADATTSGGYAPIYMPGNTTNINGMGLNDEVTAVETGGAFTMNFKKGTGYFGFVGASAYGTLGNGSTGNSSQQKYTYNTGLVDICSVFSDLCYKPGIIAGTALDTKMGITALNRAGTASDNWPMIRKGGWMALEAKTKGFVPNRVAFDASGNPVGIPAANFIEGMMVYDITNKCMKIYTQKEGDSTMAWHCISTQTCPD